MAPPRQGDLRPGGGFSIPPPAWTFTKPSRRAGGYQICCMTHKRALGLLRFEHATYLV
jgi:hypothetical protein